MFDGQYLITKDATNGVVVYSPWTARQGDNLRYTADVQDVQGGTGLVTLFHKNSADTGDGTTTASTATMNAGRNVSEFKGLKEMVRYQFTFKATVNGTIGWILFRMLTPVWFDSMGQA